jgi:hypothetical protein
MFSWLTRYSTQFLLNKLNMRGDLTHVLIGNRNDSLINRRSFNYDVLSGLTTYSSDDRHYTIRYIFQASCYLSRSSFSPDS